MADAVWYYAEDGVEKGPVTRAAVVRLVREGRLNGDDLVWRAGLDAWSPLGDVAELRALPDGASETAQNAAAGPQSLRRSDGPSDRLWSPPMGRFLLLLGLVLVVFARGCDFVGDRYAARIKGQSTWVEQRFQDAWDEEKTRLEQAREEAQEADQSTDSWDEELRELNRKRRAEQESLEAGVWRSNRLAARDADVQNEAWKYWRSLAFLAGAVLLALGLIVLGSTAQGPALWLSWVMLAVLVYSLFVTGWN